MSVRRRTLYLVLAVALAGGCVFGIEPVTPHVVEVEPNDSEAQATNAGADRYTEISGTCAAVEAADFFRSDMNEVDIAEARVYWVGDGSEIGLELYASDGQFAVVGVAGTTGEGWFIPATADVTTAGTTIFARVLCLGSSADVRYHGSLSTENLHAD